MFKRKRERLLEAQIERLQAENKELENQVTKLKVENKRFRDDLDYEHLENFRQHRKLLQIEELVKVPRGTVKQLVDMRLKIKELINTGNID